MTGHFKVYVGAQPYLDGPVEPVPTLVIDADSDKLVEVFAHHASIASHHPLSVVEAVLASTDKEILAWYQFNDSRLNGSLDLETWSHIYPNVTVVNQSERDARALDSLLDEWQIRQVALPPYGKIVLSQGDHVKSLSGLVNWESRIVSMSVCGPSAEQIWISRLNPMLSSRGFQSETGAAHWQKDPLLSVLRENQKLKKKLECAQQILDSILSGLPGN